MSTSRPRLSGLRQCAYFDEVHHENAGLGMHHAGAQARRVSRSACRELVGADHAMHRNIVADPHDEAATAILDGEVAVGNAPGERHRLHAPEPNGKLGDARG
jgi:hypothetical protein